jgi:protein involved in polysaccharide export with SLBB domain
MMVGYPPGTRSLQLAVAVIVWISAFSPHPTAAQEPPIRAPPDRADVVLRPGDRVRLKVWREPDLSGEFVVDEDGIVVFPKVGRLEVSRLPTDSLKALLLARYSASLRNPAVEVTVLWRVNVLGAVKNPGLYYVDPTTTVADALALAGGVSPDGKQNNLELLRDGKRLPVELSRESRLADSPLQSGDQLRVPERGWVARNPAVVVSAGVTAAALIVAALLRY